MVLRQRLMPLRALIGAGVCASAALLLPGCSSGSESSARAAAAVHVTARDFRITVSPARVEAGDVRLVLRNKGPDTHELIIVRTGKTRLPLRPDGLTVDEEALDRVTVGTAEGTGPGVVHTLRLHLGPGRYELFCNMAGHYMGGMRAELVVT
jgi:uncharacterized cupredoxin-like copper-binding protein